VTGADATRRNDRWFSGIQARSGVGCAEKAKATQELAHKVSPSLGLGFDRSPTLRVVATFVEAAVVDRLAKQLNKAAGSRARVVGVYGRHGWADEKSRGRQLLGAHVGALVEGREPESAVLQFRVGR
jgi:hypothetical protein